MKTLSVTAIIVSLVMIGFMLLCGLWLRSKGADEAGVRFHMQLGLFTLVVVAVTLVLNWVALKRLA